MRCGVRRVLTVNYAMTSLSLIRSGETPRGSSLEREERGHQGMYSAGYTHLLLLRL